MFNLPFILSGFFRISCPSFSCEVRVCRMRFQFGRYSNELIRFRFNLQVIQWGHTHTPLAVFPLNYSQHALCVFDEGANMLLYCSRCEKMVCGCFNASMACKTNKHNQFHLFHFVWPFSFLCPRFFFFFFCLVLFVAVSSISHLLIFILVLSVRVACGRFSFVTYLFILLFFVFFVNAC